MGFLDLLSAADVILDVAPGNKAALLELLAAEGTRRVGRSAEDLLEALNARERLGSTALGKGVALPHAEIRDGSAPAILFVRLSRPIGFDAGDDQPVDLVFAVLWPVAQRKGLMNAVADICRALRDPQVLRLLRRAPTPQEVIQILRNAADAAERDEGSEE